MAHYTKKKTAGRKKLTKTKAKVVRSKKRVQRKRTTRKNNAKNSGGYILRNRGSSAYYNKLRALQNQQNWEKRQRRLQPIKDKLSDIKESIKTKAIIGKYKALIFANDVGENLRDKYFYMLDMVDLLSAKPPDSTEKIPNSSDKELAEEVDKELDEEVVEIEKNLNEIENVSNVHYDGEEISYDALEFQKRQANELLTSTNDSREIVFTRKVDIIIYYYTEYIGADKREKTTRFDRPIVVKIVGETLVYPAINLLTDTYKIGDANRGSKPEQLLKIIGAVINNNDTKNGKLRGNPIPIPQLLYDNVEAFTPVKIYQKRDFILRNSSVVSPEKIPIPTLVPSSGIATLGNTVAATYNLPNNGPRPASSIPIS